MSDEAPLGSGLDRLAIEVLVVCAGCGFRSTLRDRRLRGVNDLSPFWRHFRFTDRGAFCPTCIAMGAVK